MIYELLGYGLELFHAIFILLLWTTPFYLKKPRYILYAIILQIAILIQLYLLKNKCILTLIEKKLLNKNMASYKGKPISRFNEFLANTIGYDGMLNINLYTPYLVIAGNAYNLYRFL